MWKLTSFRTQETKMKISLAAFLCSVIGLWVGRVDGKACDLFLFHYLFVLLCFLFYLCTF